MRVQKTMRNIFAKIVSSLVILLGTILVRKLFLNGFDVLYVGYESLFSNIFNCLSLAECGIGAIVSYHLYKAVADNDEKEIAVIMKIFQRLYFFIGAFICCVGLAIAPFLKLFVADQQVNSYYIYVVYFAQLLILLSSYFLAYRRNLIVANQNQHYIIKIDTTLKTIEQVLKVVSIVAFNSFTLYMICTFLCNVVGNIIISNKCKKLYPFIKNVKITKEDFSSRNFWTDIKNAVPQKIAGVIWGSTDSILIAFLVNVGKVGMFNNYMLISAGIVTLSARVLDPLSAGVGNLINTANKEKILDFFHTYDMMMYIIANFVFVSLTVLLRPTIGVLFGEQYLLPFSVSVVMAFNNYIGLRVSSVSIYRNTVGDYHIDRNYMIIAAGVNIILSLILAGFFDVTGIILATAVGHCIIYYGLFKVINYHFLKSTVFSFWSKEVVRFFFTVVSTAISLLLAKDCAYTWVGIIQRMIVCIIVPNVIALLLVYRKKEFKIILTYLHQCIKIISGALSKKEKK